MTANACTIEGLSDANATFSALVELLLADGTPTPEVSVVVREVVRPVVAGDQATVLIPFSGRVMRAIRNVGGRAKRVRFSAESMKSRLDIPLGLPCNHHCPWSFMGRGCSVQGGGSARGPQLTTERRVTTIQAINGKTITVDTYGALSGSKSFQFGYIERNGVRIGVQDWDSGTPNELVLRQQPPATWLLQGITMVPGCDKTIETCRGAWANEDNFGGIGYAIPAYNPMFEDGA